MKIQQNSNLREFLNQYISQGMTSPSVDIPGTETVKTYTSHFEFLGEIAKKTTVEETLIYENRILNWSTPKHILLKTYTFEVSIWKAVALAVLSPLYFIQYLFGCTNGLTKSVETRGGVQILCSRSVSGDHMELRAKTSLYKRLIG